MSIFVPKLRLMDNVYPDFEKFVGRGARQGQLNQTGCVVWFTGLSGSGKSTIVAGLDQLLHAKGYFTAVLDGDNIRAGINNNLGFTTADRDENMRRVAEVARLFVQNGIVVLCSLVTPLESQRKMVGDIIGAGDFSLVYVNTPLEVCEQRDVKGLYQKARKGLIADFTGISAPFEAPVSPALELFTANKTIQQNVAEAYTFISALISPKA